MPRPRQEPRATLATSDTPFVPRHLVGADENGVGPRLGPMVTTAVLARATSPRGERVALRAPRGALAERLGDSKALVAHGRSGLGEAWARALALRAGRHPRTLGDLLADVALDPLDALRAPCPAAHASLCFRDLDAPLGADDADAELVDACARDLDTLAARGLEILRVRTVPTCTRRLNDAARAGRSRFDVDLAEMERLLVALRRDAGADVDAVCGKVGGFTAYDAKFTVLGGHLRTVLEEHRARSAYRVLGLGTVAFVRDADASHLLVGLASLVGKWIRDRLTSTVVDYFRAHDPELPRASGYHDPVTTRFVDGTAKLRRRLAVEPACFERDSVDAARARPRPAD